MKKIITLIFVGLAITFTNNPLYANGIMGSDISWKCVGKDSFLIKLVVYSDCNSNSLDTSRLYAYCNATGSLITFVKTTTPTAVDITPTCNGSCNRCSNSTCSFRYGISKYTLQNLIVLNSAGSCCDIRLSWEECCRDAAITTGAAGINFYTEAKLNRCLNPCDNSPSFSNPPISIACAGQPLYYNPGIYDIDKVSTGGMSDSLTFQLAPPLKEHDSNISYTNGYSYDNPISYYGFPNKSYPSPLGFHFDPNTCDIVFEPMRVENTVIVILVNEYRKGVLIGQIRRDMEVVVINCPTNHPPTITTPNNITTKTICAGDSISFNFTSNDQDVSDTVTISWNNAIPGSKWTNTNGLVNHPTATLSWTPTNSNISSIPYTFTVNATDNVCPVPGLFSKSYQIYVVPSFTTKLEVSDSGCGRFYFNADSILNAVKPIITWTLGDGTKTSGNSFLYKYQNTGTYAINLNISANNGCVLNYPDTIKVKYLNTKRSIIDTQVCLNSVVTLIPKFNSPYKIDSYRWSTSKTDVFSYKTFTFTRDTQISVIIRDTLGCTISILYRIKSAHIKITANTTGCLGDIVQLNVTGGKFYNWSTGDTTSKIVFKDVKAQYYSVNITDSSNCKLKDSIFITAKPRPIANIGTGKVICTGDTITLKASGGIKYKWNTGETTSIIKVYSLVSKGFSVVVSNSYGCTDKDSVYIKVNPLPTIYTNDYTIMCYGEKAQLTATGGIKYIWSTGDTSKSILVSPLTSQYYTVLGTDSNHCSSSDSILVIVQPLPIVNAGNNKLICEGESVILQASGALNYKWMNGKTNDTMIVAPVQTTIYKVTGYDQYGCSNIDSVMVTVNPKPKANFNASPLNGYIPLTVQFNNLSNISSGNIKDNYWNFGDGYLSSGLNPAHIYTSTSMFDVTLIVISDKMCVDTMVKYKYIDCNLTGIEDANSTNKFNIYPNPTTDNLSIEINGLNKDIVITLTDLYGKEMKSLKVAAGQKQIVENLNLAGFANGVYFLNISGGDIRKVIKVLKW